MKNGKAPTRRQKQAMVTSGLNPNHWLVYKKKSDYLHIVHRETGTTKMIIG